MATMRIVLVSLLALIVSSASILVVSAAGPQIAPLPVEAIMGIKSVSPYNQHAISSDGEWLAYVVQDPSRARKSMDERHTLFTSGGANPRFLGCDLWVTNIRTGKSRDITSGTGTNAHPSWSPNGEYLAFLSDRDGEAKVWLWEKESGRLHAAAKAFVLVTGFFDSSPVVWTSDSKRIAVVAIPEGMSIEDEIDLLDSSTARHESPGKDNASPLVYSAPATVPNDGYTPLHDGSAQPVQATHSWGIFDLALIEVATGRIERLVRRSRPISVHLSPDGQSIAFCDFHRDDFVGEYGHIYDLAVLDLRSSRAKVLVPDIKAGFLLSWSPDSRSIVYAASKEFFIVPAEGGTPRQLTSARRAELDTGQPPLWDESGKTLYVQSKSHDKDILWSVRIADGTMHPVIELTDYSLEGIIHRSSLVDVPPPGRWIYTLASKRYTGQQGIYRVDLQTHQFSRVLCDEDNMIGDALLSSDGTRIVWKQQDALHPTDLWVSDVDFKHLQRLTHNNPELDDYVLGHTRLIGWRTAEGKELHGGLILPAEYREGQRYPLVVCVYGGVGISGDINEFSGTGMCDFNLQLLATRGYAVLFADSSITEKRGKPMQEIAESVLPGIDQAIALGVADPERIGVMGQSYGAYSALALTAQSTRFKAVVSVDGMSDLFTAYGVLASDGAAPGVSWSEDGQGNLGGSPWQHRDRYIENSPFFFLDRVQSAVLLIHGTADGVVMPWLGDQTFVALRRLGKEVTYVKYQNGGHTSSEWSHGDQVDYCNRVIVWFDKYLKSSSSKPQLTSR